MTSAVPLALGAAVCFAAGSVLQQRGTMETEAGEDNPRFLLQAFRRPVWVAGALCMASGWVLQAAALDRGPLATVQALTALSLVLMLPLGAVLTGQVIDRKVVGAALTAVAGIVLFVSTTGTAKASAAPSALEWWGATLAAGAALLCFYAVGHRRRGSVRAACFGCAAGFAFGYQGAVTKAFVGVLGGGLSAIFSSWSFYALVLSALIALVLQQSALKTGILAPAVASANAVTLFVGVFLGVTVFDETLSNGAEMRLPAIAGLLLALIGVVRLTATSSRKATA